MEPESFTPEERRALAAYVTDLEGPVFALTNLPEVVKGALFARYSRSRKSLRRLLLDEFLDLETGRPVPAAGLERAEELYDRIFNEYGDDSVAQLGGAHLAVEGASNILTKVLERGRLMAYLEQSTRYIPFTDKVGGAWKYHIPRELDGSRLREAYIRALDDAFETYARWLEPLQGFLSRLRPRRDDTPPAVYRRAIRAQALDFLRGLLPAATISNVGIYGSGQAYETLLLRMRAHPLREVRACAASMLRELRKVIPSFLKRVDQPERGIAWSRYLGETRAATEAAAQAVLSGVVAQERPLVTLSDFDPEGEIKVVAAALYEACDLPDDQLLAVARRMDPAERLRILQTYVGRRLNRRHRPGRALERTSYRFDIVADYGAFRDLQRHRILTIEWQELGPGRGYILPREIEESGAGRDWRRVMERAAALHGELRRQELSLAAPYVIPMAYGIRFVMQMNAREAMHVLELRTSPQGHPSYRRVCQEMHRLIAERAGHRAIAEAMRFVDHSAGEEGRLDAEVAAEDRRRGEPR